MQVCPDPAFDDVLERLFGVRAPLISEIKPFLVSVTNHSQHVVVAYTVAFNVSWDDGRTLPYLTQFWYPDAATSVPGMPRGREMYPGEERIVGVYFEIDPTREPYWVHNCAVW